MDNVQEALNKLYSQLYGSITIPSGIIEQEELDVSMQMNILGFYDEFKYEELNYD